MNDCIAQSDLWAFDFSLNMWALMYGVPGQADPGSYCDQGFFSVNSKPPSRAWHVMFFDEINDLVIVYGGSGTGSD